MQQASILDSEKFVYRPSFVTNNAADNIVAVNCLHMHAGEDFSADARGIYIKMAEWNHVFMPILLLYDDYKVETAKRGVMPTKFVGGSAQLFNDAIFSLPPSLVRGQICEQPALDIIAALDMLAALGSTEVGSHRYVFIPECMVEGPKVLDVFVRIAAGCKQNAYRQRYINKDLKAALACVDIDPKPAPKPRKHITSVQIWASAGIIALVGGMYSYYHHAEKRDPAHDNASPTTLLKHLQIQRNSR